MTTTTARPVAAGDTVHFIESGMSLDTGEPGNVIPHPVPVPRGTTVTLTSDMIANSRDRYGTSWLDLADDEDAQLSKWGRVMFRRGPWPEREPVLRKGSKEALIERDRRRAAATHTYEGDDLQRELRAIDAELGAPKTVTDLGTFTR